MINKRLTLTIIAALFIALALCLLPWPTRIDVAMHCAEVADDGQAVIRDDLDFTITGWKLDYLFREDTMEIDVEFADRQAAPFLYGEITLFDHPSLNEEHYRLVGGAYDPGRNRYDSLIAEVDSDLSRCALIWSDDTAYLGSSESDFDAQEILGFFSDILE